MNEKYINDILKKIDSLADTLRELIATSGKGYTAGGYRSRLCRLRKKKAELELLASLLMDVPRSLSSKELDTIEKMIEE